VQVAVVQARWSSGTFLLYAGGLIVLVAAGWALTVLSVEYGDAGLVGWTALVMAVLGLVAGRFRRREQPVAAGIFAFAAVLAFASFVGALESWWGWTPGVQADFSGVSGPLVLVELATIAAALAALRVFRFPLLVAIVAAISWAFVTDLVSNGGDWSAVVSFVVGLVFLLAGLRLDRTPRRPYGFWLHVAAGLAIGGSVLWFWHSGDWEWALVAVVGLLFVGYARTVERSSWAVLGAFGLFLAAGHFAAEWGSQAIATPFFGGELLGSGGHRWAGPLVYAFLGFLLVALGVAAERSRRA
jgi:hypothetical protein